jgi:Glucodextranase, domain B
LTFRYCASVRRRSITLAVTSALVLARGAIAGDFVVFGPRVYQRAPGSPVTITGTFRVTNPSLPYRLRVTSGGVTDALIALNGQPVLRQEDFESAGSRLLEREVLLQAGDNQVDVLLKGDRDRSMTVEIVGVDSVPPSIQAAVDPPANANGWNNTTVLVTFRCSDGESGIATCPAPVVVSAEGSGQLISGRAVDTAGNVAATSVTLNIDKRPPVVTATQSSAPNASGWHNGHVVVSFDATDAVSGIADGSLTPPVTLSTDGTNETATGQATDLAGNVGFATVSAINIDQVAPVVSAVVTPPPNGSGWNNTAVTVGFTCTDSGSGVASCPADQPLSQDGFGQTATGAGADRAGNTATASATVNIDTTPPVLTLTSPVTGTTVFTSVVSARGTIRDALSGVARVTCNGMPATITGGDVECRVPLAAGQNLVSVEAMDLAGNASRTTLSLTYVRPPVVTFTAPENFSYVNITPTTVTGTVDDPTATVTINSISAPVVNGSFSMALPLAEGPNIVTATATSAAGAIGTATVGVTLDTTPPHVTITTPADAFVTNEPSISVAGIVNDIVVGTVNDQQARVKINGIAAQVANRTFVAAAVPLSIGPNTIQAMAIDRVGNSATTQITVIRRAFVGSTIRSVSGNNQTATIGTVLPAPLVVGLSDAVGNPASNKPVIFKVTQNDGLLSYGGLSAPTIIATTDAQGQARVQWTLGNRAGAGGNVVEAYSVGFDGTAVFAATGGQGAAGKIVVDTGNDQIGAIGQALPKPFIAVVVDDGNNRLDGVPVTFTVKRGGGTLDGAPNLTVLTDSDGRAAATLTLGSQEGNANNLVEVDFPNDGGSPASFTASGRTPGNAADTSITGVVLDNSNVPVPGATVRAVLTNDLHSSLAVVQSATAVQTDSRGQFSIPGAPVGFVKLLVDGSTVQRPGSYPSLEYDIVTVAGRSNDVGQPMYLLPLDESHRLCVSATTGGGTLTIPIAPGFSLTFAPGQVTFPGGSKSGCVSATVVHGDKVPMVPGFGQQPRFIVTIQPAGAVFNPPAPITLPNVDGLRPREVTEMYSFDHDIGSFVAIGTGTVSNDGLTIRSNPGVGVLKAGWHCGGNPNQVGDAASLGITVAPTPVIVHVGDDFTVVAAGTPASAGHYDWPPPPRGMAFKGGPPSSCQGSASCPGTFTATASGETTVTVCFTTATASACTSAPVKVWAVQTLTFEAIDSPLDANPNAGGGLRIFPDKQTPSDTVDRSKVRVRATITPAVANRVVFFKSFDVDDPSSDTAPVDTNGPSGDDNRGIPHAGCIGTASCASTASSTTDATGVATVEFKVTSQPGNNFKVAASGQATYVNSLVVDRVNLKDVDGRGLPTDKGRSTDLLTVWRKLHVEIDSMGTVTGNRLTGNITRISADSTQVTVDNDLRVDGSGVPDGSATLDDVPAGNGRFEHGTVTIAGVTTITTIDANGHASIARAAGLNLTATPLPFEAIDNDVFGNSTMAGTVTRIFHVTDRGWALALNVVSHSETPVDWPDFIGGTISIGGGPAMAIQDSFEGQSLMIVDENDLRIPYSLTDDDAIAGDVPDVDTSGMEPIFAPAYILPAFDTSADTPTAPFELNSPFSRQAVEIRATKGVPDSTDEYWVVTVLSGYQTAATPEALPSIPPSAVLGDNDPDSEGTIRAVAYKGSGVQGVILLMESIRDWIATPRPLGGAGGIDPPAGRQTRIQEILNHEVGHLFCLEHTDGLATPTEPLGGVMNPSGPPVDDPAHGTRSASTFTQLSLAKIRDRKHPGVPPSCPP